jgi:predicted dehydrogenase
VRVNRRNFLKTAGTATAEALLAPAGLAKAGPPGVLLQSGQSEPEKSVAANDHIHIALIGAGGQGQYDAQTAVQVPGVRLVAAADCYDGRLTHAKELWGADIQATREYREILERKDVDAVIVGTPDHWHKQVSIDAMRAGKDVYCEKPMIHLYSDGPQMVAASRETGRILQIGSQRVSNILYIQAKELLAAGAIGTLNMVAAHWDRNSAIGAWDYTVPPDASPETCDWERFLGTAPQIPFSAEQFFQWRKWKAYGSGVAGDLFVHLFSGTHFITGAKGPTRAMATGGLRFWKDGRNVPDVMLGLFDYPEGFNLALRVNFVDGGAENEGLTFTGSEGTMQIGWDGLTLNRVPRDKEPGLSIGSFANAMQQEILAAYGKKYPEPHPSGPPAEGQEKYVTAPGYSDSYDHLKNFFQAVRTRQPVMEDAVFGYRAAGAALLSNLSYDRGAVVEWDPVAMKLV